MFGMLSVLAELQRELIVANTNDGLAAAPNSPNASSTKHSGCTTTAPTPSRRSPCNWAPHLYVTAGRSYIRPKLRQCYWNPNL